MVEHYHYSKIEEKNVEVFNSKGTKIRKLIDEERAPNFIMRRFEIEPGGLIGVHAHPWEHEIYILEGELFLTNDDGKTDKVEKGEFLYIPPAERHGYVNENDKTVSFICMIPKKSA